MLNKDFNDTKVPPFLIQPRVKSAKGAQTARSNAEPTNSQKSMQNFAAGGRSTQSFALLPEEKLTVEHN